MAHNFLLYINIYKEKLHFQHIGDILNRVPSNVNVVLWSLQ